MRVASISYPTSHVNLNLLLGNKLHYIKQSTVTVYTKTLAKPEVAIVAESTLHNTFIQMG